MASLWRQRKGVCVKELTMALFLFQFFHDIELQRVIEEGPWMFEQHHLLFHRLEANAQPIKLSLFHLDLWAQVYDMPVGFMSEKIARRIGDYVGTFVDSDIYNFDGVFKSLMHIRVKIDVRLPLK